MDNVVVHCSQEFDSGQTYVALSRIKSENDLQVIGFQKRFLFPPPREIEALTVSQVDTVLEGFQCCRSKASVQPENNKLDRCVDEFDAKVNTQLMLDWDIRSPDHIMKQYFETNQGEHVDPRQRIHTINVQDNRLSHLPVAFSTKTFLETLLKDPCTSDTSNSIKNAARYGLEHLEMFEWTIPKMGKRAMHPGSCGRDSFSKRMSAIARKFRLRNITVISRRLTKPM